MSLAAVLRCGGLSAAEPTNLSSAKGDIAAYVDSGRYSSEIENVAREATSFLTQRAASVPVGAKVAVVIDLDETLLSNLAHMRAMDFGYVPTEWDAWVARGEAPAIEPVRALYRTARRLGFSILLLSGRRERDRPGTEKNLRFVDVTEYAALVLKPNDLHATNAGFKTAARARFEEEGWTIVANIGDQASDLTGGHAERTFKLPDPFYLTP